MARKKTIDACPEVRTFQLSDIHEAPYNPRIISDTSLEGLAFSIQQFGCVEPIIVNIRDGRKGQKPPIQPRYKSLGSIWVVGFEREGDPTEPAYYTDVWRVDWDGKKRQPMDIEHPTVKPVELFSRPIRVHTRPGDIVLEPFCGSGTQLIAAEKTGRRCFAIEKEPFFCDVAVQRWEAWTGQKAKRLKKRGRRGSPTSG